METLSFLPEAEEMLELRVENQTVFFGTSEDMSKVNDGSVDFVVTSLPYWNLKIMEGRRIRSARRAIRNTWSG